MQFGSEKVVCPFYVDETRNTIKCEGIFTATSQNNFVNSIKKQHHQEIYCYNDYERCLQAKILLEKYNLGE